MGHTDCGWTVIKRTATQTESETRHVFYRLVRQRPRQGFQFTSIVLCFEFQNINVK